MADDEFYLCGEIDNGPTKQEMAALLRDAGLSVTVGAYSVRVTDCERFIFQEYGGDLGDPCIDAEGETLEGLLQDARRVSQALTASAIRHRFELYNESDELVGYLHHHWPQDSSFPS